MAVRGSTTSSNRIFACLLGGSAAVYPMILAVLMTCCAVFARGTGLFGPWQDPAIVHAAWLSVATSIVSGIVALAAAIPCGYVLSRYRLPGWRLLDVLLYLPIVLPPLVIGVSLLVFFRTGAGKFIEKNILTFTFAVPGIVAAQSIVSAAFATRVTKLAFDGVPPRRAGIARTLGATRWQAFFRIELREAFSGLIEAFALAWAHALGTFGPIIMFCGTTRNRTEVLSTSIFLEFSVGNLDTALALSVWMAGLAAVVMLAVRSIGGRPIW